MNTQELHSYFNIDKLIHDKMSKLYIYQAFLTFAKSMIGIFVPVYLFKLGFLVSDILFYLIGHSLVYLLLMPISTRIISIFGFKKTILLSTPIYIIHLICLNFVRDNFLFFTLSWLTFGIYTSIFWPAMHSEIGVNISSKHRGSQLGTMQIITILISTLAPLLGGFFLENISYWYLLLFSSILIFLGTLPLLFSEDIKIKKYVFNFSDFFNFKNNYSIKSKIAFASEGLQGILNIVVWPIIVFVLLSQNFFKLGILFSLVSFITIFVILYFKKFVDSKKREKYLKLISQLLSLNWLFKSITILFSSFFLYFVEMSSKLILNLFNMSYMSIFYLNARKKNYLEYIIFREFYLHIARMFVILFVFIPFLFFFKENLVSLSCLAFFGVFFSLGLSYLSEE